ncbi:MAG: serine/threonine-protein kinase [Nannocystaceae bacterium]
MDEGGTGRDALAVASTVHALGSTRSVGRPASAGSGRAAGPVPGDSTPRVGAGLGAGDHGPVLRDSFDPAALGDTLVASGGGAPSDLGETHADGSTRARTPRALTREDAPRAAGGVALSSQRYRERGGLGEGGMGVVSHVDDLDLLRELAVKRLRPELRDDDRLQGLFLWEARVTAHLDHPGIVPIHDLGIDGRGELYFTMRYVHGRSLEDALAGLRRGDPALARRLSLPRRLRLFTQLCQAIEFAHARGVLHRDLKPGNVMLGAHGELLVMDWGLAVALPGAAGEAIRAAMPAGHGDVGGLSGTPLYMSPEQARGEALDVRSDVFTLGVILHELCALTPPYDTGAGTTVEGLLECVRIGDVRPLAGTPGVSPGLAAIVARATAQWPDQRYQTVTALREDLEIALDGGTPSAEQASLHTRIVRFYHRDNNPWIATLRAIDMEFMMGSAALFGGGIATLMIGGAGAWGIGLLLAALAVSLCVSVPWIRRTLRARREGVGG